MADHQEERERCEVHLHKASVGHPLPLVAVDLVHGREPFGVIQALEDVADSETMSKGQACKAYDEPGAQAILLQVPPLAAPVVGVEIRAAA